MTQIKTRRLLLRPAKPEDLDGLFEVYGDKNAMRYWDRLPHESRDVTQHFLNGLLEASDDLRYFVVEHEGRAVGTAGFWQGDEVGYILHPRLWGQGLGREVLDALIAFGFDTLRLERITADVDPRNAASINMLLRAGFVETGRAEKTLKVGEDWVDSVYLALERPA